MDKFKKALMIVAIVAIVAIAGSAIYYFIFFKPKTFILQKNEQIQQEEKTKYYIDAYFITLEGRKALSRLLKNPSSKKYGYNDINDIFIDIVRGNLNTDKISLIIYLNNNLIVKETSLASEIIRTSQTEISYINFYSDKEEFLSADYITYH